MGSALVRLCLRQRHFVTGPSHRTSRRYPEGDEMVDRGNSHVASQHRFENDYHMTTLFTVVSSTAKVTRWQKGSSSYKTDHVQQEEGRRHRSRIAISLLTNPLPLELHSSSIRPLNEVIRKFDRWAKREGVNEDQRKHLGIYREIQRGW